MWGIIPAAGRGTRIQPLAFSKELLVGTRAHGDAERPCAVSEYLVERMLRGGADKICFVIAPGKSDILDYYGAAYGPAAIAYVVQPRASGLCDAIFRALPLVHPDEPVIVGLPDTVWFPADALAVLPSHTLTFLLFPVDRPEFFDAVVCQRRMAGFRWSIDVKSAQVRSRWIWGAFKMPGRVLAELRDLWHARQCRDEYIGTLVNAWIAAGRRAGRRRRPGTRYVDVGTLNGYRAALGLLQDPACSHPKAAASRSAGRKAGLSKGRSPPARDGITGRQA